MTWRGVVWCGVAGSARLGSAWCGLVRFCSLRLGLPCGVWCVGCCWWLVTGGLWRVVCCLWFVALACGVRLDRCLAAFQDRVTEKTTSDRGFWWFDCGFWRGMWLDRSQKNTVKPRSNHGQTTEVGTDGYGGRRTLARSSSPVIVYLLGLKHTWSRRHLCSRDRILLVFKFRCLCRQNGGCEVIV